MTCVAGLRDLRGVVSYRPFLRFINKLSLRRGLPLPGHRSHHTISLLIILIINHTVSVQSHIINHTISLLTANPSNPRWTPCWWVFFKHHDSIFQTGFYDSIYSDWFLWFYMFKLVSNGWILKQHILGILVIKCVDIKSIQECINEVCINSAESAGLRRNALKYT